ncbi:MAG: phage portal protein [Ignavibacteria bacterium]|nr:phage portal protein [Ignavibacteria bacterium]
MIEKLKNLFNYGKKNAGNLTRGWQSITEAKNKKGEIYKSYVYACVNARAENIAKARIYLYKRLGGKRGGLDEIFEHSFLKIINIPNRKNQSFETILYLTAISLDLYGNATVFIEREKKRGEPKGIYFLPYNGIKMTISEETGEILNYEYTEKNRVYRIPKEDIIHFTIPQPTNNYIGKATVSAFNFTLDIDYFQNYYQKSIYENDANLGLILEAEGNLTDEQYTRMIDKIDNNYTGYTKPGRSLILEGGIRAKNYQATPKDVEMIPARQLIRDEILSIMRVPKTILGITNDVNYANAREAIKVFTDYTIKPFAKLCIESKLNIFLRENYKDGENLKCVMEYEFEQDREMQLKSYEIYRKYNIASIEEIRELEGFEKLKK